MATAPGDGEGQRRRLFSACGKTIYRAVTLMKSYTCLCPRGMNTSRGLSSGARRGFGLRRPPNAGRQLETGLLKRADESLSVYATLLFVGAASGEQRRRSSPALFSFRAGDKLVGVGLLLSR